MQSYTNLVGLTLTILNQLEVCMYIYVCVKQETEVTGADVDGELASDLHQDLHLASSMLRCHFYQEIRLSYCGSHITVNLVPVHLNLYYI